MSRYIAVIGVIALLFCFSNKGYCGFLDDLKKNAKQAASEAVDKTISGNTGNNNGLPFQGSGGVTGWDQMANPNKAGQQNTFTKEDILSLKRQIKTNLNDEELIQLMDSPLHIIAYQVPDFKFGIHWLKIGEGQLSQEQKQRLFMAIDTKGKYRSKIISTKKINDDTILIEAEYLTRRDPAASPKSERFEYYFRQSSPGAGVTLVQVKALNTPNGVLALDSYQAENAYIAMTQGIEEFLQGGVIQ